MAHITALGATDETRAIDGGLKEIEQRLSTLMDRVDGISDRLLGPRPTSVGEAKDQAGHMSGGYCGRVSRLVDVASALHLRLDEIEKHI